MKVGDLVVHKGTGKTYLIVDDGGSSKILDVLRGDGTLALATRWWLEVISEDR
jgi:hypothetical protein